MFPWGMPNEIAALTFIVSETFANGLIAAVILSARSWYWEISGQADASVGGKRMVLAKFIEPVWKLINWLLKWNTNFSKFS